MEPRSIPPRTNVEYFLDAAQEAAEMDGCTGMTLRLYGDDDAIEAAINAPREHRPDSHFKNRRKICLALADQADAILPQLSEDRRAGLISVGMRHLTYEIANLAEIMACWAYEDSIEGGYMEDFKLHERSRNGITFKRTDRRLRSPKYIRRYVKLNAPEHADHLSMLHALMLRRARTTRPVKDASITRDWQRQLDVHRASVDRQVGQLSAQGLLTPPRRERRRSRRVIRRSLNIALSVLGRETVSSFLRGETIRLLGQETMLMLRKRGSLLQRGHGALSIAIADKHGTTLADLCTYIEDTPTLDQLTGFALLLNSGEERKVLATANITRLGDGATNHPIIAERRAVQAAEAQERLIRELGPEMAETVGDLMLRKPRRSARNFLSMEQRRERNQAYFEATKSEWVEAMYVFVIGCRNFHLYETAEAI